MAPNGKTFTLEGVEIPQELLSQPSVYQHPDPILRRLRLEDSSGSQINDLKSYFRDKRALIFYFGGFFGEASLREFHRDLALLAMRETKHVAVIYVSVDTKLSEMTSIVHGQPWLRMTFHDGSDFAPIAKSAPAQMTELLRGEDFVPASELDEYVTRDVSVGGLPAEGYPDELEYSYARPFSRAALAAHADALRTPAIAVYHLPSHRWLDKHARKEQFRPGRIESLVRGWKDGRNGGVVLADVWDRMKFTLLFALAALLYQALIYFRPDYDLLPTMLTNLLGGNLFPKAPILPPSSSASAATAVQAVATTVTKAVGATMTMPTVRSVTATI